MKQLTLILAGLLLAGTAIGQEARRIYRTDVIPYNTRQDSESGNRAKSGYTIDFRPSIALETTELSICTQEVEIPYVWTDGVVFIHIENHGHGYTLLVNDQTVATIHDPVTPSEHEITPLIREGANDIKLLMFTDPAVARINPTPTDRPPFEGSYLYYQNKRSVADFRMKLVPDSTRKFGILELEVIARNAFNYEETVSIGYDIYDPSGKLKDFNIVEVTIPGRSVDTLRFHPHIYHAYEYKWEPSATKRPPLYRVTLFTRRMKTDKEYMPLYVGFGKTEFKEGKWVSFDRELTLKSIRYNAETDRRSTATRLAALRKQGYNTLEPDYPQPAWFYDLCDAEGFYVIDKAAIDAPKARTQRSVGGTPSNDPTLAEEYLERVKAMYYRSRNHTCVIAYALGNPSGNGYNMYLAYEWLKSVEQDRPVIYIDADGEWNSDL